MAVEPGGLRGADVAPVGSGKVGQVGLFVAGQAADVLDLVYGSQFVLLKFSRQHCDYLLDLVLDESKGSHYFIFLGQFGQRGIYLYEFLPHKIHLLLVSVVIDVPNLLQLHRSLYLFEP